MTWLWLTIAALALANMRWAADRVARWRHWRVGRWGVLLCVRRRVGESCLHCRTDYRYVLAHPIRYTGDTKETARAIIPLCQRCWLEASEDGRLAAAARILNEWRRDGVYGAGDDFDRNTWDDHRLEIYSAVKGGL
jgi:hypothetical protein